MTSAELSEAMKAKTPVIFDHPLQGVMRFERIVGVEYKLTEDMRHPTNTHDGITVSVTLADYCGRSTIVVDPKCVHAYTRAEFERRKLEHETH